MNVAPHPHTGLQTVTWLFDGEVLHDDSLGSESVARPGGVNVMTSGRGIAHAEQTPRANSGRLNGAQLWVALPVVGAEVLVHPNHDLDVGLADAFEHSVLLVDGDCAIDGAPIEPRRLYYLGTQRTRVSFSRRAGGRVPPFPETILMWWNFVARTPEEIAEARADWQARRRFGDVRAYKGPRLEAPELARIARANPMS